MPARIIVDPAAITANLMALDALSEAESMSVIKANGYGHGRDVVAQAAVDAGVRWLGVAQGSEALQVAEWAARSGTEVRILTWIYDPDSLPLLIGAGIDVSVSEVSHVLYAATAAAECGRVARIHLKIDTGMSRGGATAADFRLLVAAAAQAVEVGHCEVAGVWSHLARADEAGVEGREATAAQQREFDEALAVVKAAGLGAGIRHLAASAGGLAHPGARYDMVRWGIAQYGYAPSPDVAMPAGVRPALRVEARLTLVKRVDAGRGISYGALARLDEARWLGIVPLGYANGIPRLASGKAWVSVNGHRVRQLGRICMDQFVIDLGSADREPLGSVGDIVDVLGGAGPDAAEWAEWAQTIPYEILTGMGVGVARRLAAPV
nr:alanine racemase [Nanchangia anserum]